MLASYIIQKNEIQFRILIVDKKKISYDRYDNEKNLDLFIHFYVVQIQLLGYDKKLNLHIKESQYIMIQDNHQKLKEVEISSELFIQKTVDNMYLDNNQKKK